MASSSNNYSPNDYIYIVCKQAVYIKQLKTSGPINTPLKVRMSTAYSIVCSGIKIYQYDPVSKQYALMTIKNAFKKNKFNSSSTTKAIAPTTMSLRTPRVEEPSDTADTGSESQGLTAETAPVQTEENVEAPVEEAKEDEKVEETPEEATPVEETESVDEDGDDDEQEEEAPVEEAKEDEKAEETKQPTNTSTSGNKKKKKKKSGSTQKVEQSVTEG